MMNLIKAIKMSKFSEYKRGVRIQRLKFRRGLRFSKLVSYIIVKFSLYFPGFLTIWIIKDEKRYNRAQRMQGTISARCIPGSLQPPLHVFSLDHFRLHMNDVIFVIAIRSCQVNICALNT